MMQQSPTTVLVSITALAFMKFPMPNFTLGAKKAEGWITDIRLNPEFSIFFLFSVV